MQTPLPYVQHSIINCNTSIMYLLLAIYARKADWRPNPLYDYSYKFNIFKTSRA